MENKDYAKEYGLRCKQIRQAKGLSQQALSDLMHVTPQAVSKWEKEGIVNVNTVMQLSNVLGQDITADQIEQEGAIGEIGREILNLLSYDNDGYMDFDDLISNLYGLSIERISNEVFKLERIGLLVREQYRDFLDNDRDGVIITAKGLIAYKNNVLKESGKGLELKPITLEMRLSDGESCIQDLVNNDRISQLLWQTNYHGAYRIDYLRYLKNRFRREFPQYETDSFSDDVEDLIAGWSCFADLMFRMARGITDDDVEFAMIDEDQLEEYHDFRNKLVYKSMSMDENTVDAQMYLSHRLEGLTDFDKVLYADGEGYYDENDETARKAGETVAAMDSEDDLTSDSLSEKRFLDSLSEGERNNCSKWFTNEEVLDYIKKNYSFQDNENQEYAFLNLGEREKIDAVIQELWKLEPKTLEYFYQFPDEWENNGLAQAVRDKFGVPPKIQP